MNKKDIFTEYKIDKFGRIISPGRFEGEPYWTAYYWNQAMDGAADGDAGVAGYEFVFALDSSDYDMFPKLLELIDNDDCNYVLAVGLSEYGFIQWYLATEEDHEANMDEYYLSLETES